MTDIPPTVLVGEGPALLMLHADGVAHIRLNRAESANGLNIELLKALHEGGMRVHGDGRGRSGLITGEGSMGLVCSADFVVAAESARFLAGATRVSMVPDAGVSVTLTQLVGLRRATEILMLNPTLTAAEAKDIGLITRVVPDDALEREALALARQLAAGAPAALANTKRLLWSGIGQGVEAVMPEENHTQAVLSGMADALEGLAAVIDKRAPRFTGL